MNGPVVRVFRPYNQRRHFSRRRRGVFRPPGWREKLIFRRVAAFCRRAARGAAKTRTERGDEQRTGCLLFMGMLELYVLRLILWIGLPLLLVVLLVGPSRTRRGCHFAWKWLTRRRLDPEQILTHVVRQHEEHVAALRKLLTQEEAAEAAILTNLKQSGQNLSDLEQQTRSLSQQGDDLAPRGALQAEPGKGRDRQFQRAARAAARIDRGLAPPAVSARIAIAAIRSRPQYPAQSIGCGRKGRAAIRHRTTIRSLQRRGQLATCRGPGAAKIAQRQSHRARLRRHERTIGPARASIRRRWMPSWPGCEPKPTAAAMPSALRAPTASRPARPHRPMVRRPRTTAEQRIKDRSGAPRMRRRLTND